MSALILYYIQTKIYLYLNPYDSKNFLKSETVPTVKTKRLVYVAEIAFSLNNQWFKHACGVKWHYKEPDVLI